MRNKNLYWRMMTVAGCIMNICALVGLIVSLVSGGRPVIFITFICAGNMFIITGLNMKKLLKQNEAASQIAAGDSDDQK